MQLSIEVTPGFASGPAMSSCRLPGSGSVTVYLHWYVRYHPSAPSNPSSCRRSSVIRDDRIRHSVASSPYSPLIASRGNCHAQLDRLCRSFRLSGILLGRGYHPGVSDVHVSGVAFPTTNRLLLPRPTPPNSPIALATQRYSCSLERRRGQRRCVVVFCCDRFETLTRKSSMTCSTRRMGRLTTCRETTPGMPGKTRPATSRSYGKRLLALPRIVVRRASRSNELEGGTDLASVNMKNILHVMHSNGSTTEVWVRWAM
ncbi:uncharacterized protein B0H18DRAFT_1052865 [Fomitopsis serialis]|uniref:uncharacterized protein n=1 Tax=Fomitopsis serialis TaxID=139415 RepID=UPI00200811E7|nr:uncharacterized protein B0H18DRAFT_1052865 [Neoantrodia serialis]KAH9912644.1 hypothetical protein B0H18DRAFT_1052865 [Neoantrodia serialis]